MLVRARLFGSALRFAYVMRVALLCVAFLCVVFAFACVVLFGFSWSALYHFALNCFTLLYCILLRVVPFYVSLRFVAFDFLRCSFFGLVPGGLG